MLREDILNDRKELVQKNDASSLTISTQLIKVLELVTEAMPQDVSIIRFQSNKLTEWIFEFIFVFKINQYNHKITTI